MALLPGRLKSLPLEAAQFSTSSLSSQHNVQQRQAQPRSSSPELQDLVTTAHGQDIDHGVPTPLLGCGDEVQRKQSREETVEGKQAPPGSYQEGQTGPGWFQSRAALLRTLHTV